MLDICTKSCKNAGSLITESLPRKRGPQQEVKCELKNSEGMKVRMKGF
jgi:hypothetical protein